MRKAKRIHRRFKTEGGGTPAPTDPEEGQIEEAVENTTHFVDKEGKESPSYLFQKGGKLYQERSFAKVPDASFLDVNDVLNYSLTANPKYDLTKCPSYLANKCPTISHKVRQAKHTAIQNHRALHDRICQKYLTV